MAEAFKSLFRWAHEVPSSYLVTTPFLKYELALVTWPSYEIYDTAQSYYDDDDVKLYARRVEDDPFPEGVEYAPFNIYNDTDIIRIVKLDNDSIVEVTVLSGDDERVDDQYGRVTEYIGILDLIDEYDGVVDMEYDLERNEREKRRVDDSEKRWEEYVAAEVHSRRDAQAAQAAISEKSVRDATLIQSEKQRKRDPLAARAMEIEFEQIRRDAAMRVERQARPLEEHAARSYAEGPLAMRQRMKIEKEKDQKEKELTEHYAQLDKQKADRQQHRQEFDEKRARDESIRETQMDEIRRDRQAHEEARDLQAALEESRWIEARRLRQESHQRKEEARLAEELEQQRGVERNDEIRRAAEEQNQDNSRHLQYINNELP